jgi:hypothetical protein
MAAGLGFKEFTTGDVLTAADANGYLASQVVMVFADAAARTSAIASPQEGMISYLKDTNAVEKYDGAAWVGIGGAAGASALNPNLVINGNFTINQRAYVSAANLASGAYGFDRWKSNFTNTTLTFTSAPAGQEVTINSGGGLQQIVEQANVPAGTYVLSFSGTATARIYNSGATPPSYAASPITFTADGLANVVVEFTATGGTKTLSKVKLELGSTATSYTYSGGTLAGELAACQRYYFRTPVTGTAYLATGMQNSMTQSSFLVPFPMTMRVAPTSFDISGLSVTDNGSYTVAGTFSSADYTNIDGTRMIFTHASNGATFRVSNLIVNSSGGYLGASAEL